MAEPQTLIGGRYRLVRRVGSGGMGIVWEASDERLERRVALKQLHRPLEASPAEAEVANKRAMREARTAARLHHPHAVSVFDVVEQDGQLWLVMPFIASITLAAVLHEGGPLQPDEAAKVGAQVASALTAAHAAGIVHRDVKPGNILIAEDGTALISDFGIAYGLGDATLTSSGMIHGTPAYLAPEIARGDGANFSSDVFSLGSTLYSAMEGKPPFGSDDNTMALLHRVASGQFPAPQHCGPLTPLIMDMLSADPSRRPSMRAVADALAGVRPSTASPPSAEVPDSSTEEASTTSVPDSLPAPALESSVHRPTEPRRNRGLAAVLAIVLLGGGILLAALLVNDRNPANPTAGTGESTSAPPTNSRLATPTPDTSSKTPGCLTDADSITDSSATDQISEALPCSLGHDSTDGSWRGNSSGASAGDHELLRVATPQHRGGLAWDDGFVSAQPCRGPTGVPEVLGCNQQDHCDQCEGLTARFGTGNDHLLLQGRSGDTRTDRVRVDQRQWTSQDQQFDRAE